jgi:hypothetical protein
VLELGGNFDLRLPSHRLASILFDLERRFLPRVNHGGRRCDGSGHHGFRPFPAATREQDERQQEQQNARPLRVGDDVYNASRSHNFQMRDMAHRRIKYVDQVNERD